MRVENNEYIYNFDDNSNKNVKSTKTLDENAFLRLLTAQLSNQDPLSPMEDKEFIAQLAQFSALEQIQNLNTNFVNSKDELFDALENLNLNQINANVKIMEELVNLRKAIESYVGEDGVSEWEE